MSTCDEGKYFIGIDVGTGSARAAIISTSGKVLNTCVRETKTWNPKPDHYEQSSDNIWKAICECVQQVLKKYDKNKCAGIGFDATCSLVALDNTNQPITVSTTGNNEQNIMLWMDHRSTKQTDFINDTKHDLLKYIGGKTSPEAQCPKMLWIKENLSNTWKNIGHFFDLPDFLTYKATNCTARSLCSTVCKFNYDALNNEWSNDFFQKINLSELCETNFKWIGTNILPPGTSIGNGLCEKAANEFGLIAGIPVGASLVDAYAGGLSLFGCTANGIDSNPKSRMALICGTSTCHMSIYDAPIWANGAWGPFKNVLFIDQYVHAAGQSISGKLVDHIIENHPAYQNLLKEMDKSLLSSEKTYTHHFLNNLLEKMAKNKNLTNFEELTNEMHIYPDYHGNRSPLADPSMRGMICGLNMSNDLENLAILYLAVMQSLAYGTRSILDSMKLNGRPDYSSLIICGGLSKNPIFVQTYANACKMPVLFPNESEMVLIGAGILAATAAKLYLNLEDATKKMAGMAQVIYPKSNAIDYHNRKYSIFMKMLNDQRDYRKIMLDK